MMTQLPRIEPSPDGPLATSASAHVLKQLLELFEAELTAAGAAVAEWLAPGLGRQEVIEQLAAVGLTPPDELIVWFGWHNGYALNEDGRAIRAFVLPRFMPASLELAIARYRILVLDFVAPPGENREEYMFGAGEGWLRIQDDTYSPAVECSAPPAEAPRLRSSDPEFHLDDTIWRARSLCTLVTWWIEGLRNGAYRWNDERQAWDVDDARTPAAQRESGFL